MDTINLLNFDAPEHRNSRYVLTSPRSLRACSNLGIKPTDLLSQSVEKFRQSNHAMATFTDSTLEAVYEEFEKQRKIKLERARKERLKLIEADNMLVKKRHIMPNSTSITSSTVTGGAATADTITHDKSIYSHLDVLAQDHRGVEAPKLRKQVEQNPAISGEQNGPSKEISQLSLMHESFHSSDPGINQDLFKLDKSLQELADAQKVATRQYQQLLKQMEQGKRYQTIMDEEQERLQDLNDSLTARHKEAEMKRITLNETKLLKLKMKKIAEKERFERQKQEVEQEKKFREESLKESYISKHTNAELRLEAIMAQKEEERRKSLESKREKELHRLELVKRLDDEYRDRQESINKQLRQNMQMATEIHDELIANKVICIRQKRQEKWEQHMDSLNRLRQEEEEQRAEALQLIAKKDRQMEAWTAAKEAQLSQSLLIAQTSAKLRQSTKSESTFAEMVKAARFRASFEERQRSPFALQLSTIDI